MPAFIKKLNFRAALVVVIFAGFTAGFLNFLPALADGPQFNIFDVTYSPTGDAEFRDLPLLDARKVNGSWSADADDHANGVTAAGGEEIEFRVYYHNGVTDTEANAAINTIIKAFSAPAQGTAGADHWVSATIEAQNAAMVSSDELARGGSMQVHVEDRSSQSLNLVPGSAVLYKNWGSRNPANGSPDISQVINLPDTIFTGGVNIGDVRGCWPFFGFVVFRMRLSAPPPPPPSGDFTITKEVRNVSVSASSAFEAVEVTAQSGQTVEFKTTITASGATLDMRASDIMDAGLALTGSVNRSGGTPLDASQFFTSAGVALGQVAAGSSVVITYQATVSSSAANDTVLVNRASAAAGANVKGDEAQVRVQTVVTPPPAGDFTITKSVRNVTVPTGFSATEVTAQPGHLVEFQVVIAVPAGSSPLDMRASDSMDAGLQYNGTGSRSNATPFGGALDAAYFTSGGISIGQVNPGSQVTITFQATVSSTATNGTVLVNRASAAAGANVKGDEAQVRVQTVIAPPPSQATIRLVKVVTNDDGGTAVAGDFQLAIGGRTLTTGQSVTLAPGSYTATETNRSGYASLGWSGDCNNAGAITLVAGDSKTCTITNDDNDVPPPPVPNRVLLIQKQVLNVSRVETIYRSSTAASENEIVRFRLTIEVRGDAGQTAVTVRDVLPPRLAFVAGSADAALVGAGLSLGSLPRDTVRVITLEARVTGSSAETVTNTATVRSTEVGPQSASATVDIAGPGAPSLSVDKQVLNITAGETSYRNSTNALAGERVRFRIIVEALIASQNNVIVRDILPTRLTFDGGDAALVTAGGISLGTLAPGAPRTVTLEAVVTAGGAATVTNTAFARSDSVPERSDDASVVIVVPGGGGGGVFRDLSITKRVMNVTDNTNFRSSVSANPGDRVRFEIIIEVSGFSQTDVTVRDVLPSRLAFASGDNAVFASGGRNFGTLNANTSRTITYEATVAGASQFSGTVTTLTNGASVRSDEVGARNASAQVFVTTSGGSAAGVQFENRKTAFNVTQGLNATQVTARPGDIIAYTLFFRNTGSQNLPGVIIEDNISDILELAEITDQGGAVSVNSSIRWPAVDILAGTEVSRSFRVRVKNAALFPSTTDFVMVNVYGNEVRVAVSRPAVLGVTAPPRTGPAGFLAGYLAMFATGAAFLLSKRRKSAKLVG